MKPVVFGTTARIQPLPHWGPPDSFPCSPFGVLQTLHAPRAGSAPGPSDVPRSTGTRRKGGDTLRGEEAGACLLPGSGFPRANAMGTGQSQASVQWGFCLRDSGKGQGGRRVES